MIESYEQSLAPPNSKRRRSILKGVVTGIVLWPAKWVRAFELSRPIVAFQRDQLDETLDALFADRTILPHDGINIIATDLAENGAVVPIKIEFSIDHVASVIILATENPIPLIEKFDFLARGTDFVATRIKLASSCDILVVVETQDGLYSSRKSIEVTIGGCSV